MDRFLTVYLIQDYVTSIHFISHFYINEVTIAYARVKYIILLEVLLCFVLIDFRANPVQ